MVKKAIPTIRGNRDTLRGAITLNLLGFSRHHSGVPQHLNLRPFSVSLFWPGETESGSAGTQPDKGYPGRRCAHGTAGPWRKTWLGAALLLGHGTPEPCLKKSSLQGKLGHAFTHRFSRGAEFFLVGVKRREQPIQHPQTFRVHLGLLSVRDC